MEHLTRDELLRVLAEAKKHRERDRVMILVAYWHGLRASEVISLLPSNFSDGHLTVQRLKGSKRTSQPLVRHQNPLLDEKSAVEAWLENLKTEKLFPITRFQFFNVFRLYCRRAKIPQHLAHVHVLKHSIAMHMIDDAGIQHVRQYLGHKSLSSTGAYLEVDDQAASAALAKAEARGRDRDETSSQVVDSLGGISVEETLRRVLREIEQEKARKGKAKPRR